MPPWKIAMTAAALALAGCSGPPPVVPGDTGGNPDVAAVDAAPTDTAPACLAQVPAGPFGSDEGRYFRPWTLQSCAEDVPYEYYGPENCQVNVTVMVASAGWCVPCQAEAPMIQALAEEYADRGVRIIGVMMQNPDYSPPTRTFCNTWRTRYGQTHPFVIDPMGTTLIYFPNMAYPANVIVDREGRIRLRQYGVSSGLRTLRETIDSILAEYGL